MIAEDVAFAETVSCLCEEASGFVADLHVGWGIPGMPGCWWITIHRLPWWIAHGLIMASELTARKNKMRLVPFHRRRCLVCLAACFATWSVFAGRDFALPSWNCEPSGPRGSSTGVTRRLAQREPSPVHPDLDSSVSAGLVAGTLKGFMVGSGQYLWLIWQHLSSCPQALKADAAAQYLRPSENSFGSWCFSWFSSSWTFFFADVFHKHMMVQVALQVTVGSLCAIFVLQLLWSISSQQQGHISEARIGFRAWKAVISLVFAGLASRFLCQYTLSRFCVQSSWTGLPYYTEGHILCAVSSVLGATLTCSSLSVAFAQCHKLLQRRGRQVPLAHSGA